MNEDKKLENKPLDIENLDSKREDFVETFFRKGAEFTSQLLTELQSAYEHVLDEELDKRNFRRKVLAADILEETPHVRSGVHRPARLYRFRPDAVAEVKARRLFP